MMFETFAFPQDVKKILAAEDDRSPLWIVGGALRDHLVRRTTQDFDFVTSGNAIALARRVADALEADVYILDQVRGAGRVVATTGEGLPITYDFTRMRGNSIEADLRGRDFSINALALRITQAGKLIDPCEGLQHLRDGVVELCTPDSIEADPIRSLRAIRIATDLNFKLSQNVVKALRRKPPLASISRERVRDELFSLLSIDRPATALQLLCEFDYSSEILSISHRQSEREAGSLLDADKLHQAVRSVRNLSIIKDLLARDADLEIATQASLGILTWMLGRYREGVEEYLGEMDSYGRPRSTLLLLSTFLRAAMEPVPEQGLPSQLPQIDQARNFRLIGESLRLSREELSFMDRWLLGLAWLDRSEDDAIPVDLFSHRYFRHAGNSGIGAVLSSLAYELSDRVEPPPADLWSSQLERARSLFGAWFESHASLVEPIPLVTGDDVIQILRVGPGPVVGEIMRAVIESQVVGAIRSREDALQFVRKNFDHLRKDPT